MEEEQHINGNLKVKDLVCLAPTATSDILLAESSEKAKTSKKISDIATTTQSVHKKINFCIDGTLVIDGSFTVLGDLVMDTQITVAECTICPDDPDINYIKGNVVIDGNLTVENMTMAGKIITQCSEKN